MPQRSVPEMRHLPPLEGGSDHLGSSIPRKSDLPHPRGELIRTCTSKSTSSDFPLCVRKACTKCCTRVRCLGLPPAYAGDFGFAHNRSPLPTKNYCRQPSLRHSVKNPLNGCKSRQRTRGTSASCLRHKRKSQRLGQFLQRFPKIPIEGHAVPTVKIPVRVELLVIP